MRDPAERLQALLGRDVVEHESHGIPRVAPDSPEGVAVACRAAVEEGWTIHVEGNGTWVPPEAGADIVLSTRALDRVVDISPTDLVATVEPGVSLEKLRRHANDLGMWLAIDPPGRPDRTLGSIVATGTAGALRAGFGPVRDHVLGCSVVAGDGRLLTSGGRVMKNVAGYDLTKLHVGAFGGFGIITELHLRLRALPGADVTLTASGDRDALSFGARAVIEAGLGCAALELLSPAVAARADWTLAARLTGPEAAVQASQRRIEQVSELAWNAMPGSESAAFWGSANRAWLAEAVTLRLGVLVDGIDDTLDLLAALLDDQFVSAGALSGGIRWAGSATPEDLLELRRRAAEREIPVTLERAPWTIRSRVGHFGAYREGVGTVVARLREVFDPNRSLRVALEETASG